MRVETGTATKKCHMPRLRHEEESNAINRSLTVSYMCIVIKFEVLRNMDTGLEKVLLEDP